MSYCKMWNKGDIELYALIVPSSVLINQKFNYQSGCTMEFIQGMISLFHCFLYLYMRFDLLHISIYLIKKVNRDQPKHSTQFCQPITDGKPLSSKFV